MPSILWGVKITAISLEIIIFFIIDIQFSVISCDFSDKALF